MIIFIFIPEAIGNRLVDKNQRDNENEEDGEGEVASAQKSGIFGSGSANSRGTGGYTSELRVIGHTSSGSGSTFQSGGQMEREKEKEREKERDQERERAEQERQASEVLRQVKMSVKEFSEKIDQIKKVIENPSKAQVGGGIVLSFYRKGTTLFEVSCSSTQEPL